MNTNTHATEAETIQATYCPAEYATLFNNGSKRVIEVSKTTLDLAVGQTTEVLATCKKALPASMPGLFLFDLAGQALEGYVTLQKSLLDLAIEQSTAAVEATHEYIQDASKAKAGLPTLIQQSVERTVTAQKSVLEFAAQQTTAVSDTVKQQPGVTGTAIETVTDSIQRGVDTLHETQNEILDSANMNVKAMIAKA
jgi:hypothetical protein